MTRSTSSASSSGTFDRSSPPDKRWNAAAVRPGPQLPRPDCRGLDGVPDPVVPGQTVGGSDGQTARGAPGILVLRLPSARPTEWAREAVRPWAMCTATRTPVTYVRPGGLGRSRSRPTDRSCASCAWRSSPVIQSCWSPSWTVAFALSRPPARLRRRVRFNRAAQRSHGHGSHGASKRTHEANSP